MRGALMGMLAVAAITAGGAEVAHAQAVNRERCIAALSAGGLMTPADFEEGQTRAGKPAAIVQQEEKGIMASCVGSQDAVEGAIFVAPLREETSLAILVTLYTATSAFTGGDDTADWVNAALRDMGDDGGGTSMERNGYRLDLLGMPGAVVLNVDPAQ